MAFPLNTVGSSVDRMKHLAFAFGLLIVLSPDVQAQTVEHRTLPFGCNDLVVIARVKNGEWQQVEDPDDILGHGWFDATLRVRQVIKGRGSGRTMSVRYFAHTYMREDRDFMLVLSRQPDGSLVINSGQLMSARPKLAPRCD